MKKQRGITLIALIITIVVLLILAAVTISLTLGERGIFNTAQQAGKNYKEASDKELADLTNLEKEMQNAINGTGNGGTTKPEPQPVKLNTLGAEHYGEYVDYPIEEIGRGPSGIAETHKSDWRIFYNDGTYVYLIASYVLQNNKMPTTTSMQGQSGRLYASYWPNEPTANALFTTTVRKQYKMNWDKSETNPNIKCVSELLNTSNWAKFVNSTYAEDAIGTPTLEMWVDSWNATGNTKLYYNNSNENGYYVGNSDMPTTTDVNVSNSNTLYFPGTSETYLTEDNYWLASPSSLDSGVIQYVYGHGSVNRNYHYFTIECVGVRPIIRLKADVMAKQNNASVWDLQ